MVIRNLNQNRRGAPSSGWQAFDDLEKIFPGLLPVGLPEIEGGGYEVDLFESGGCWDMIRGGFWIRKCFGLRAVLFGRTVFGLGHGSIRLGRFT
jgi:hypothetical protein